VTTDLMDTTTFSLLMRSDPSAMSRLESLPEEDRIIICTIVRGEIEYGLNRLASGKRRDDLRLIS